MWHDGLWVKLWDMGVKGKMRRVIKNMYEASTSATLQKEVVVLTNVWLPQLHYMTINCLGIQKICRT